MMRNNITKSFKASLVLCLVLTMLMCTLTGCSPNPMNFSTPKISITLNESFTQRKASNYELYAASEDVSFTAREETMEQLELAGYEIISLQDYAKEIHSLNAAQGVALNQRDNYYYFTTSQTANGAKYSYIHCIFEGDNSFWVCQFVFKSKDYERLSENVLAWADTIEIAK